MLGEPHLLPVTLIRRQGNDILVQGAGLAGREVVIERSPLLGAGIGVRPLRPAGQAEAAAAEAEADLLELTAERRARLAGRKGRQHRKGRSRAHQKAQRTPT